jgi:hypothetical protein
MSPDLSSSYPEIVAIFIAVAGIVMAGLLARLTESGMMRLERYLRRRAPSRLEQLDLRTLRQALRGVVYYGTLVVFLLVALHTLSITLLRDWIVLLLQYVPQLILGGLIILSGYLIGVVTRSLLAGLMGVSADHLVPRLAELMVITAAVLTGLAQTSINISFISHMMVISLGLFFGGLSLAFALGSRQLVENLLARRALDRYRIGDQVRINEIQGRIIEILGTSVVLESSEGVITVPCARFVDSAVVLVNSEQLTDDDA